MDHNNPMQNIFEMLNDPNISKKTFLCSACAHQKVCKNIDNKEDQQGQCQDFLDGSSYEKYSSIYSLFQPIFNWLQLHYPSGEVEFVVDHHSAKMITERGPYVFSKELKEFNKLNNAQKSNESNGGTEQ